jgi:hypothetical protein
MKITDVKLYVLEDTAQKGRLPKLVQVENLRRIQYTHSWTPADQPARQTFIEVITDDGLTGRCTTNMTPTQVEILRLRRCAVNSRSP